MQAHRKRLRLPAIIKMSHCTLRKLGIPMTGISVFSPVPQGAEYGGLCRRRHNARAECRAAPALFRRPAQYDLPPEIVFTPHGAPPRFLCLRSWLCTRAVVCIENMRRASASAVCGTRDGTVFSAAFGSGGCARIFGTALLFPSRRFRTKKCELEGAITARCLI